MGGGGGGGGGGEEWEGAMPPVKRRPETPFPDSFSLC